MRRTHITSKGWSIRRREFAIFPALAILIASQALSGCMSKSKAKLQQERAYLAGQREAAAQAQQQAQYPTVHVIGPVRNPIVSWSEGMTLGRALYNAGCFSNADPTAIVIHRGGQDFDIDLQRFYAGDDYPVVPGDVIELR